jgi:uncharacterized cupredoxin-like copper-binding protein
MTREQIIMKRHSIFIAAAVFLSAAVGLTAIVALPGAASAHGEKHYAAGEPGDPKKPARTIKVTMFEHGKKMLFKPDVIEVRLGEQIRFVLENDSFDNHEFILATRAENKKHGEVMKKFPNMEHDDPNGLRLTPYQSGEILWRFSKRGTFEYACLIPGHFEAGMHGKIIVK